MKDQTPLERLDEALSNWDACHPNDFEFFSQRLFDAALAYRDHAEAKIRYIDKKLSTYINADCESKHALRDAEARIKELEAEVQALHETPLVSYFLNPKPKEGNDDN